MFEVLDQRRTLTGNQKRIIIAAILGDMLEFFDYFLKGSDKPDWMTNGIPYIDREKEKEKIDTVYGTAGDKKDIKQ